MDLLKHENRLNDLDKVHTIAGDANVVSDIITSLCGRSIGGGSFRDVFEYQLDQSYVVKIEPLNTNCNTVEWMIWLEVQHLVGDMAWVKEWFAPVLWISPTGKVLVMKKTEEKPNKKRPEKIPAFFWDVKADNFGWIGNKFVCHDYGQFHNMIHYPRKMKKVRW